MTVLFIVAVCILLLWIVLRLRATVEDEVELDYTVTYDDDD